MREMSKVRFSLKEDFDRFCNEARDHDIQLRGANEKRLSATVSGLTDRDIEIIEQQYNGRVVDDTRNDLDGPG